jgi:hypothetical protein
VKAFEFPQHTTKVVCHFARNDFFENTEPLSVKIYYSADKQYIELIEGTDI